MNFKYYNTTNLIILILILSVPFNIASEEIESAIKNIAIISSIYSYMGIFSTVALITVTLVLIDNWLWRISIWGWRPLACIINVPNLNGRYKGELVSSYNNKKMLCVMEIKQTASKIKIFSYFGDYDTQETTSESISVSEDLILKSNNTVDIYYNFSNESAPLLDISNHFGTANLVYYSDKRLKGKYFNLKGNRGAIDVVFEKKEILGRI